MLYWICPECGHECSPAIRECPTCTAPPEMGANEMGANELGANASHDLFSLAQSFQSAPSGGLLIAVRSSATATAVAIEEPREPELSNHLAPLRLAVRPVRPGRLNAVMLSPAPVPVRISSPAVARSAAPTSATFRLQPAGPAPVGEIGFRAARGGQAAAIANPAEPLPSRRQAVAFVRAEWPVPDRGGMSVANLAHMSETPLLQVAQRKNGQPKDS